MSPAVVFPGQKTTLLVNPGGAPWHRLEGTFLRMIDIKIDDTELNMNPFIDEESNTEASLSARRMQYPAGYVMTQTANPNAQMTAWFHGSGNAYEEAHAARTCDLGMTDCYSVRIMPSI